MATASKRGNSYRIRSSAGYDAEGRQIQKSKTWTPSPDMSDRQIAKELERQKVLFDEQIHGGQYVDRQIKFEPLAREWLQQAEKEGNLKPSTLKRFRQTQERVFEAIGHLFVDKISTRQIQAFINNLAENGINKQNGGGLSTKSQELHLNFISDVFKYAIKNGFATDNPCRNVTAIKTPTRERVCYTPEQAAAFLSALEDAPIKYKTFFMLAIYGGFRRGELLGFEWKDIDFADRVITVNRISVYDKGGMTTGTPKTKTSQRSLKLPEVVFDQLREYRAEQLKDRFKLGDQWHNTDSLFTQWNGLPMGPDTARHWLEKFCTAHNLPIVNIHSFRHLNASLLISSGADIRTVSSALGHSQTSTTLDIYAHAFQEQQAKAAEAVADALKFAKRA